MNISSFCRDLYIVCVCLSGDYARGSGAHFNVVHHHYHSFFAVADVLQSYIDVFVVILRQVSIHFFPFVSCSLPVAAYYGEAAEVVVGVRHEQPVSLVRVLPPASCFLLSVCPGPSALTPLTAKVTWFVPASSVSGLLIIQSLFPSALFVGQLATPAVPSGLGGQSAHSHVT